MKIKNNNGITLVESLVGILLLSVLLISLLGAFFISRLTASHAKHRMVALNTLKEYLEREIQAKYDGGSGDEADFYATVSSADPVNVTIDDRSTSDTADDLIGTVTPDPYFPNNIEDSGGTPLSYYNIPYKIVGFVISWTEDYTGQVMSERGVTYVSYHSSS